MMQYTRFGATGLEVSRFGLGCMRFPKDESQTIEMVRYAVDHGVNYLDTAYVYRGSEDLLAKALKNGYRKKVNLVTKAPLWNIDEYAGFERYLDIQLKRLKTDYIDVYLLHNLYGPNWDRAKRYNGFAFLEEMKKKGKIGVGGLSIHATLDAYKEIIDAHAWEVIQIQLNILDAKNEAGIEGLEYGAATGAAMVIMEPLRGGNLVTCMPRTVAALLETYPEKRSIVEWAFRWLYDRSEIAVVLSGTTNLKQLKDNLRIFKNAQSGCMSEADQELIAQIRTEYEAQTVIGCTTCDYCMPCPQNVAIPTIFRFYNNLKNLNGTDKLLYSDAFVSQGRSADRCVECGACEKKCPQRLPIIELLKTAHGELLLPRDVVVNLARDKA